MKNLFYIIFMLHLQFSYAQNEKLIDFYKTDLGSSFNAREEQFEIGKYINSKSNVLSTKIAVKYFNKLIKIISIEPLYHQETLEYLGQDTILGIVYPIGKIKVKDKNYLFLFFDNGRTEFVIYIAIYNNQDDKIESVLKIMSGILTEREIFTFRYCKEKIVTTTYKSKEIKKTDKSKESNFAYSFVNNYFEIYPNFKHLKTDTTYSNLLNGDYDVYSNNPSSDDPVLIPCK